MCVCWDDGRDAMRCTDAGRRRCFSNATQRKDEDEDEDEGEVRGKGHLQALRSTYLMWRKGLPRESFGILSNVPHRFQVPSASLVGTQHKKLSPPVISGLNKAPTSKSLERKGLPFFPRAWWTVTSTSEELSLLRTRTLSPG
mmetsp:Transcript_27485/g.58242  ORF Transcript_27485/g.58242 Transcript_27485/m.58242 type:complete len:142 (-) Transcript_27485:80-505(-)